jgi:hypothetical protein
VRIYPGRSAEALEKELAALKGVVILPQKSAEVIVA